MADDRLSGSDAVLWAIESDPILRPTIVVVTMLDAAVDVRTLRRRVESMVLAVPKLRAVVAADPLRFGPRRWVDAGTFAVEDHFVHLAAPAPGGERELLDVVRGLAVTPFRRDAPPWESYLIDGLHDGRSVFVLKMHHVLTDGVGAVQMAAALYDLAPDDDLIVAGDPVPPRGPLVGTVVGDVLQIGVDAVRLSAGVVAAVPTTVVRYVCHPVRSVRSTGATIASIGRLVAPPPPSGSSLIRGRGGASNYRRLTVDLEALRAAGHRQSASINDAFVAAVAGALDRYHERSGASVPRSFRYTMPVDLRRAGDGMGGNRFVPTRFDIRAGIRDPRQRVAVVHERCRTELAEPGLEYAEGIASVLAALPTRVTTAVMANLLEPVDAVVTNVPGFAMPLRLVGAEVRSVTAFAPTSGAAVNVALLSYCGQAMIGVVTDDAAVVDADLFVDCLAEALAEVIDAGAGPPPQRPRQDSNLRPTA